MRAAALAELRAAGEGGLVAAFGAGALVALGAPVGAWAALGALAAAAIFGAGEAGPGGARCLGFAGGFVLALGALALGALALGA